VAGRLKPDDGVVANRICKTRCFFGVLRFGLVKWEGEHMLPDHGINAAKIAEESKCRATVGRGGGG